MIVCDMSNLIIRPCTVAEVLHAPNFGQIAEEYGAESSIKGMPHPLAKMDMYVQLEAAGALTAFGAFVDDLPVGFITVLSTAMPHYSAVLSVSESFFVLKKLAKPALG